MEKLYLIHGFMGTGQAHFSHQIEAFKDDYDVIALDLPGHGNSTVELQGDYIEGAIRFVEQQIEQHGKGYVVGLSLGATLAIHLALRTPELMKGIVITGYSPFIPDELKGIMEEQHRHFLSIEDHEPEVAAHFNNLHGEKWKKIRRVVLDRMTYDYPSVSAADLAALSVPALILNGSIDPHEVDAVAFMKKANPAIETGLIPGGSHIANMDCPKVYNEILRAFLEKKR
ncbi:alpha/beta fold hydrolase [Rossellomorea marisflavi]|uniref:alpha/beta fold hydrolase n=1 Tax=Rossellomorea marisflavi TaxID=189381 RepID=UPI0011E70919|nr:alpha/beta fold hydrolase [Rossellomorea marisflavi]QHA35374.1 alpha/beta fold hydrolase [Rossellomorea marisflavi]TYO71405.1 alpha/beta fold hydrolase [Rossellomorea marisflavi]